MNATHVDRHAGAAALPDLDLGARARGAVNALAAMAARWLRNRAAERQMSELSDFQLRDLGIGRADIARVAWHGRD
jgi:uncharacterized protein YjiS (DUF1127 family)